MGEDYAGEKGFTLVELIVTLTIIGILAAIIVPTGLGYIDKQREEQCRVSRLSLLAYLDSDRVMKPGETIDQFLSEYILNSKEENIDEREHSDSRYNIKCPSGGIYECRAGEELWCSVHDGGEKGFKPEEETDSSTSGDEPEIEVPLPSGTVTIKGGKSWEEIIEEYYGPANRTVPQGVYEDKNGNVIYVYWYWTPKTPTDTIDDWNNINYAVAAKINTKYYLNSSNIDSYKYHGDKGHGTEYPERGTLYFDGQDWYLCYNTNADRSVTYPPNNICWKKIDLNIWNAEIIPN